jgi:hypothetical protein
MRFAFLVYVSRSGSTLVARTLASHSRELVVLPEFRLVDVLVAEGDASVRKLSAARLLKLVMIDKQIGSLGFSSAELEALAAENAGKGIRALMEALVARYIARHAPDRRDATTALIKLGSVVYIADQLATLFPEAMYLHVYRDPRAVTSSLIRHVRPYFPEQKMGRGDPVFISREYKRVVRAVRELAGRAPVLDVQYEQFCADPTPVIENIARFFGVAFEREASAPSFTVAAAEQGIHQLVDQAPIVERTTAWQTELPGWAGLAVERTVGDVLGELGYQPHFATGVSPAQARAWHARSTLFHMRCTAEHYVRRLNYYRTRPSWLGNRMKLALRRRGRL